MPHLIVEVPLEHLEAEFPELLAESIWKPAGLGDLYLRVDPKRPQMKQMRHVHIAHRKHISAPGKQVSWNEDGSRHDAHLFDKGFKGIEQARSVARIALRLPENKILEHVSVGVSRLITLLESQIETGDNLSPPDFSFLVGEAKAE